MPDTIASVDKRLLNAREAFYDAMEHGNLLLADIAYKLLDELLDLRNHVPLQRKP